MFDQHSASEENESAQRNTVIFDFDGTLVSKDTGTEFFRWLIQRSFFRSIVFTLALPAILTLVSLRRTRRHGLNVIFFIALTGQGSSLLSLQKQFIPLYFTRIGARRFPEGLEELKQHQQQGRKVVILSGCPEWLLKGVVRHLGIKDVTVMGSPCRLNALGLVMSMHCVGSNKLLVAKERGISISDWHTGYSDSRLDLPMLKACTNRVLINVREHKLKDFDQALSGHYERRQW